MPLLSSIIKVAPIIARYARSAGKFTSGETAFVGRFPPRYRDTVRTVLKGSQTVFAGGLVSDILKGSLDDNGMEPDGIQKKITKYSPRKSYQTRNRFRRCPNRCKQQYNRHRQRSRY